MAQVARRPGPERHTEEASQPVFGSPVRETSPQRLPVPCHHCRGPLCSLCRGRAILVRARCLCNLCDDVAICQARFVQASCLVHGRKTVQKRSVRPRASKNRLHCRATGPNVEASAARPGNGAERRSIECIAGHRRLAHGSRRQVRGVARPAASRPPVPPCRGRVRIASTEACFCGLAQPAPGLPPLPTTATCRRARESLDRVMAEIKGWRDQELDLQLRASLTPVDPASEPILLRHTWRSAASQIQRV